MMDESSQTRQTDQNDILALFFFLSYLNYKQKKISMK